MKCSEYFTLVQVLKLKNCQNMKTALTPNVLTQRDRAILRTFLEGSLSQNIYFIVKSVMKWEKSIRT